MEKQWGTGVTNDNAVTDRVLRTLISDVEGQVTNLSSITCANWEAVPQGWGGANANAQIELVNEADNYYIKLTVGGTASWYANAITFRTTNYTENMSGIYELTIEGKADENNDSGEQMQILVLSPALKSTNYELNGVTKAFSNPYFAMSEAGKTSTGPSSAGKNANFGNEFTELKYIVDMTKIYDSGDTSTTAQTIDANAFSQGIIVAMTGKVANQIFYIKSISLKEIE